MAKVISTKPQVKLLNKLVLRYQRFVEKAYNLRYTDEGQSDYFSFEAIKLLQKINELNNN